MTEKVEKSPASPQVGRFATDLAEIFTAAALEETGSLLKDAWRARPGESLTRIIGNAKDMAEARLAREVGRKLGDEIVKTGYSIPPLHLRTAEVLQKFLATEGGGRFPNVAVAIVGESSNGILAIRDALSEIDKEAGYPHPLSSRLTATILYNPPRGDEAVDWKQWSEMPQDVKEILENYAGRKSKEGTLPSRAPFVGLERCLLLPNIKPQDGAEVLRNAKEKVLNIYMSPTVPPEIGQMNRYSLLLGLHSMSREKGNKIKSDWEECAEKLERSVKEYREFPDDIRVSKIGGVAQSDLLGAFSVDYPAKSASVLITQIRETRDKEPKLD